MLAQRGLGLDVTDAVDRDFGEIRYYLVDSAVLQRLAQGIQSLLVLWLGRDRASHTLDIAVRAISCLGADRSCIR